MSINIIGIAAVTATANVNLVLEAMGRGPGNFSRMATTEADPTPEAEPTHFFMSDRSVSEEFQAQLLAFAGGTLPEGIEWGSEGIISEADALSAIQASTFISVEDDESISTYAQVEAALRELNLYIIPQTGEA